MRIVVIGQAPFGEAVFKALREHGDEVVGVCAPATPEGGRPDPLRAAAEAAGIPVLPTRRLRRDAGVVDQYLAMNAELNVMAFVTDIIPDSVLNAPPHGTIQYHPSLLPLHRGASAINWTVIMDDAVAGLSIFWPDDGLDTGPVLMQKAVPIGPDDTVTSLYFGHLFPLGVQAMVESVDLIREGKAPRIPQDHRKQTYEPIIKDEHTWIDWNSPPHTLYNLVRGANPTPGANTRLHGEQVKLFDSALAGDHPGGNPGSILEVSDSGVLVALTAGALLVKRVQAPGGPKIPAAQWAATAGARVGDTFTSGKPGSGSGDA